ncbi:MAG: TolC family protein [Desulfobulbus sp.]|nr:TolC family protein [Desulfobulbus sp.]
MIRYPFILLLLWMAAGSPVTLLADDRPKTEKQWTVYEAVQHALAHNPDIGAALERIEAAEHDTRRVKAALYPRLEVSTEYQRTNNPMYSFGNILNQGVFNETINFNNPGTTDNLQAKATVQYRLYNGGHDLAAVQAADERSRMSRYEHQAVRNRLEYEVVRAFYTIVQSENTVKIRQSAVEAINASLQVGRARFEEGSLLQEDVLDLEVQQARAQELHILAEHGLEIAKHIFLTLLGLPGKTVSLDPTVKPEPEVPAQRHIHNRPELAGIAALVKAQEAHVRQTKAAYLPAADAFGSVQADKGTELDKGSGNSWVAGIRLHYTLYDGRHAEASVAGAEARLRAVKEQQRKMELDCNLEMEQAALALHREEERLKVTGAKLAAATESARLARLRFKEGTLLTAELIDTENRLTDALLSHDQATAARTIAVADLRRAIGLRQFDQGN